jgi:hypothetical protein
MENLYCIYFFILFACVVGICVVGTAKHQINKINSKESETRENKKYKITYEDTCNYSEKAYYSHQYLRKINKNISASRCSKKLEEYFITCSWCGTRYTEKMISELKSARCLSCGGNL